ncbi:MAG: DegT/DnrJ/EryC1/StrS family aminotransferase, partial [Acidimicrobiia bacterium]|nr:DegT/DnrJ/EryC1/StrS family aminotransferase [Acidimicrobiia bacterium]
HNYRLSNLLAALGRAQLDGLEAKIARRKEIFDRYQAELPEITWLPTASTERPNHWLSAGLLPAEIDPHRLCATMMANGVEARQVFKPMHAQPVFADHERVGGEVADELFARGVCLPSGSTLTAEEQGIVIEAARRALSTHRQREHIPEGDLSLLGETHG